MSGFVPFYSEIDQEVIRLETDLGIPQKNSSTVTQKPTQQGVRGLVGSFFGGAKKTQPTYDIPDGDVDFDY